MSTAAFPDPDRLAQIAAEHGAPVLVLSPAAAVSQLRSAQEALRGVDMHYALKAFPHPALIEALRDAGAWFDVCSNGEVDVVRNAGIPPERCIHTHPIKRDGDIRYSLEYGCRTFVFDNPYELAKFEAYRDDVELMMRLSFRSKDAVVDLSYKFGCAPDDALALLKDATARGLKVRGLCFHVGSQSLYPYKYLEAIGFCRQLFSLAALEGIELDTLDIGGGFPVPYTEPITPINEFARPILEELRRQFPDTRIIAEPGRFIAAPSMTLICSVMGKSLRGGTMWYYLDEGVYGSYSGQVFDHAIYPITPLKVLAGDTSPRRPSILAGPTCDSFDVISEGLMLPELDPGDLLVSPMMGAYTAASATEFNHFPKTRVVVLD